MGFRLASLPTTPPTPVLRAVLVAAGLALLAPQRAVLAGGTGTLPYPDAVSNSRTAAEAVLTRAGAETCLRGKLTRALLGLSASCEASGQRNPLCALADRAVVVTPMSLSFMDDTARQLLELSAPTGPAAAVPSSGSPRAAVTP